MTNAYFNVLVQKVTYLNEIEERERGKRDRKEKRERGRGEKEERVRKKR